MAIFPTKCFSQKYSLHPASFKIHPEGKWCVCVVLWGKFRDISVCMEKQLVNLWPSCFKKCFSLWKSRSPLNVSISSLLSVFHWTFGSSSSHYLKWNGAIWIRQTHIHPKTGHLVTSELNLQDVPQAVIYYLKTTNILHDNEHICKWP